MHVFWLDTDPEEYFDRAVQLCSQSKYSITELESIYWLEVYPTMRWNLWDTAGEWKILEMDSLSKETLRRHKFGKRIRFKNFRPYAQSQWERLATAIDEHRAQYTLTK